ncbi:MAG: AMP-binding protein [Coriobacteriia bacterium]|nr:AMP-binding protein [Coriobacteriia bacterium]
MRDIHKRYTRETYSEEGILETFSLEYPEDFSFSYDVVDDIAQAEPDRPAMVWCNPEGEEHIFTFGDMKRYSDKTANFLLEQGVRYGDLVLVILRRHYQFWFVALALDKLGAVIVPATFMLKEHDLEYRVNSADIKTIICTNVGEIAQTVDNAMSLCPTLKTRILVEGCGGGVTSEEDIEALHRLAVAPLALGETLEGRGFDPCTALGSVLSGPYGLLATRANRAGWVDFNLGVLEASEDFKPVEKKAADPMIMYFSSGTSGNPKMVLHDSGYALAHLGTAKHWQNVKSDGGIHFTIADTGWGKAVWGKLYGQWLMEACVFTYDFNRFSGDEICELIQKYQISTLCCPPTMFRLIMQGNVDDYDLSSLEYSVTAGEALNPDLFEMWRERTGLLLTEGFGQTETPVTVCNTVNMVPKPGSMGKPIPLYHTRILDEEGRECAVGQTGEICIRCGLTGDGSGAERPVGLMMGYYRNPARTAEAIYGGWYHTGDTAWRDEGGYYWYVGRNDDIIKSSGYRIGPFEIESVMLEHPAVRECAVTGVPDPVRGKAVKATVVLAPGYEASDELTRELQAWVKTQTAPYKYPRIIAYIDALPKTVNGKVRRAVIRAEDESGAAAAGARPPEEFGG